MENHGKEDDLFPRDEKVNNTNLADQGQAGTALQPSEPNSPAQTTEAAEQPNLSAQPPDVPRRVFEVERVNPTTFDTYIERVEGHIAYPENGSLVIQAVVCNMPFTVRIIPTGEWRDVKSVPPSRRQLEAIARATDAYYRQQVELQNKVALAHRSTGQGLVSGGVTSGRQLLNRVN